MRKPALYASFGWEPFTALAAGLVERSCCSRKSRLPDGFARHITDRGKRSLIRLAKRYAPSQESAPWSPGPRDRWLRVMIRRGLTDQSQVGEIAYADRENWRLEHLYLLCSVLGAKKETLAVGGGNGLEGGFGGQKQLLVGTGSVAAQNLLDLAPQGLDRIEIRRIRRQIQ